MRLLFRRRGELEMRLPDSTPGNRALRQALIRISSVAIFSFALVIVVCGLFALRTSGAYFPR